MKTFLSDREQRHLHLVEILFDKNDWHPLTEITHALSVNRRTLLEDIQRINTENYPFQILIQDDVCCLESPQHLMLSDLYFEFLNRNPLITMLDLAFLYPQISIQDLSQRLKISISTCYRYVQRINNIFYEKGLAIQFQSSPCHITGNEKLIRSFYFQLYSSISFYYFPDIPNQTQELITQLVNPLFHNFQINHLEYQELSLLVLINYLRHSQGHRLNENDFNPTSNPILQECFAFSKHNNTLNRFFELDDEEKYAHLFYPIFNKDFPYLFKYSFFSECKQDPEYNSYYQLIPSIQQEIDQICKDFGLETPDKELLILHLFNTYLKYSFTIPSIDSIFDKHDRIVSYYHHYHPQFYNRLELLFKSLFTQLNLPLDLLLLHQFMITFFITWHDLANNLNHFNKPIHILIDSAHNPLYAELMQEILQHQLPKQVIIDVHHYLQDFEEHSKSYNIVVSNRVIAPKSGVHYLYIQNIFDWDILVDLRQTINEIRKAHLKNMEPYINYRNNLRVSAPLNSFIC